MILKNHRNLIYSGLVTVIIGYILFTFLFAFKNCHHTKFDNYKQYLWLFKDSVKSRVDTLFYVGSVRKSDVLYFYNLYNVSHSKFIPNLQFHVLIWEINDLSSIELKDIVFNENISFDEVKISSGEVLNSKSTPAIRVKYKLPFRNSLNINLNGNSKIIKTIEATNYRGFYGLINKLSLSNKDGEHLIMIDNKFYEKPTFLLVYKYHSRFFLIHVTAEKEFNENIINIFDLKN